MYAFRIHILKICLILFTFIIPFSAGAWGFWAHQRINKMAVYALPKPLFYFFKLHIDELERSAVNPDKRRYAVEGEASCHYIDLDHYGDHPFDSIPTSWSLAVIKFTEDTLMEHGIVPWKITWVYSSLIEAFKNKNGERIIKLSADLGHYVADAHVPLHCTSNYNGQLTDQHGIHGLWESRLPELYGASYNTLVGKASFVDDVNILVWNSVKGSYAAIDSVLEYELLATNDVPIDMKMTVELKGKSKTTTYSKEFCDRYHELLNGMVERRFTGSIRTLADLWYSAWIEAGQPSPELFDVSMDEQTPDTIDLELNKIEKSSIPGHTD